MKNTQFAVSEAASLATKLIARSEEGKITWDEDPNDFPELSQDAEGFKALLENHLEVRVASDRSAIVFQVLLESPLGPDRTLLSVWLEHDPKFGYDFTGELALHESLVRLHEFARRSALKVDENLAHARDFLERLAG